MRTRLSIPALLTIALVMSANAAAQKVVDKIAARVDDDIILMSDVRQLARYQTLVDGKPQSNDQILDLLIDQWVVRKEAEAARFPQPSQADIDRGMQRLQRSLGGASQVEEQRKHAGLSEEDLKRITAAQVYLSNYLDSRFRPGVRVEEQEIRDFYDNTIVPRAKSRNQNPPTFDAAHDFIQEILIQRGINKQADQWLKESRPRLHILKMLDEHDQ